MTSILRPTLFTFATVFAAQSAVGAAPGAEPGYVASSYQAKTVLERTEEGEDVRAPHRQVSSKRRSEVFDRLFDAEDRRAFRRLKKLAKRRGRGSGRVLRRFPDAAPGDVERLAEHQLGDVARYLIASGLEPTKIAKYSVRDKRERDERSVVVHDESNAYVRVADGKLRDVYTWSHQVVAVRSTYESTEHNLYVYADDGRLSRVYTFGDYSGGVQLTRVDVRWSRDRVARFEVRSVEGAEHDGINFYRIDRVDAPTVIAARR